MATVRKWICPADGDYIINYDYNQISENSPGKDRLSQFTLRRNHKIIEKNIYDIKSGVLTGNHEIEMKLETGEILSFEFYNGSEHTMETIEINISIKRTD